MNKKKKKLLNLTNISYQLYSPILLTIPSTSSCPSLYLPGWSAAFHLRLQLWALWDKQVPEQHPSTKYNLLHFFIKNLPPWQLDNKHATTCNSFTAFLPRQQACMHQPGCWWGAKVLHAISGACLLLRLLLALVTTTNALALHLLVAGGTRSVSMSICWVGLLWRQAYGMSDPHLAAEESVWGELSVSRSWLIPNTSQFLTSLFPMS